MEQDFISAGVQEVHQLVGTLGGSPYCSALIQPKQELLKWIITAGI